VLRGWHVLVLCGCYEKQLFICIMQVSHQKVILVKSKNLEICFSEEKESELVLWGKGGGFTYDYSVVT
jgi:hypothetical protein